MFAKMKEEQDGGHVLNKKIYKLADKKLLVRQRCAIDVIFLLLSLSAGIVGIILIFRFFAYHQGTCNKVSRKNKGSSGYRFQGAGCASLGFI
jgi:hypothetical protein